MSCSCRVFIATSLDGFIARPDGSIEWLTEYPSPSGEDYGYAEFMRQTDTVVIGRKTFELTTTFDSWPYVGKKVVVLTTRALGVSPETASRVATMSGSADEIAAELERAGSRSVYVDGGQTIQAFIKAGLIDEMTITRLPCLIGKGIPLFGLIDEDITLRHVSTQAFPNGFVQSTYRVGAEGRLSRKVTR